MMKRLVSFLLVMAGWLFSLPSQAFICNGKDISCLAWAILPFNQTNTSDVYEWAPISGTVTGIGNKILFTFRFNSAAISTFQYNHAWYAPTGIIYKKFGFEIDICDWSGTLRFHKERIGHNFPWNAYASRDIDTSDWVNGISLFGGNGCTNAIGLLIQDASVLQPNVDYKVLFFLKDPLPANGVIVSPSFQIVADTNLLLYAQSATGVPLFPLNYLGDGYREKFNFFALEGKGYSTAGWKLYADGRQGMQWTNQKSNESSPVSYPPPPTLSDEQSTTAAPDDPGDRMLAATIPAAVADPPATQADFIVDKFWIENTLGNKVKVLYPGEPFTTKGKVKNRGNANSPSAITVKYYLSNGRKVDSNKQEVGSDTIQAYNLPVGGTHTESVSLTAPTTPGIYNYTFCADTGNAVSEKHESNNCSDELVVEVVRRSPAEAKRFVNSVMSIIND